MAGVSWMYGTPVDPRLVAAFEAERGIRLPASYRAIVAEHDGACPEPDIVAFADDGLPSGRDAIGMGQLYRFVGTGTGGWTIHEANEFYAAEFPGLTFISECANGWAFALDYGAAEEEPPVVLVRFGCGTHEREAVIALASSFDQLLAKISGGTVAGATDAFLPPPEPAP